MFSEQNLNILCCIFKSIFILDQNKLRVSIKSSQETKSYVPFLTITLTINHYKKLKVTN